MLHTSLTHLVCHYILSLDFSTIAIVLSGKSGMRLDWMKRLKVALDSANGLTYLHELANPPIIHRDVKSNNILLDNHLNAKVADFGLSKLLGDESKGYVSTQVKGTLVSFQSNPHFHMNALYFSLLSVSYQIKKLFRSSRIGLTQNIFFKKVFRHYIYKQQVY